MLKVVVPEEYDGRNHRSIVLIFEIPDEKFDLDSAIHAAATEFCKTEEGRKVFDHNCESFNWGDFALHVSNEICEKHGFKQVNYIDTDEFVDFNKQLVDEEDILGDDEDDK